MARPLLVSVKEREVKLRLFAGMPVGVLKAKDSVSARTMAFERRTSTRCFLSWNIFVRRDDLLMWLLPLEKRGAGLTAGRRLLYGPLSRS